MQEYVSLQVSSSHSPLNGILSKVQPNHLFSSDFVWKMILHTEIECDRLNAMRSSSLFDCVRWHGCYRCQTHCIKSFNWNRCHGRDLSAIPQIWHLCLNHNSGLLSSAFIVHFFYIYIFFRLRCQTIIFCCHCQNIPQIGVRMWLLLSGMHSKSAQYNYPAIRNAYAIHINALHCCAHHFTQTKKAGDKKKQLEATRSREATWESQNTQMIRILPIFISVTAVISLFHFSQLSPRIKWKFTHIVTSHRPDASHEAHTFFFLHLIYYRIFLVYILVCCIYSAYSFASSSTKQRGETMTLPNRTKGVYDIAQWMSHKQWYVRQHSTLSLVCCDQFNTYFHSSQMCERPLYVQSNLCAHWLLNARLYRYT